LVEASAGTGKTYSIALLSLRLIIEKDIPIFRQLLVTYTNAAVAELQHRIRKFIALAGTYAAGESIDDDNIKTIIDQAGQKGGITPEQIRMRLKASLMLMDEATIVTIHSFCQQMLNKYAFDTQQVFDAQLRSNISDIIEDECHKFWRRYITTLRPEVLEALAIADKKSGFSKLIGMQMSGRCYATYSVSKKYTLQPEDMSAQLQQIQSGEEDTLQQALRLYDQHREAIAHAVGNYTLKQYLHDPEIFLTAAKETRAAGKKYIEKFPTAFLDSFDAIDEQRTAKAQWVNEQLIHIRCFAIQEIIPAIQRRLSRNGIVTFDHLIRNLWSTLQKQEGNAHFIAQVRKDFQAVFIDEFQDTDHLQFDIFSTLFLENPDCITFLIGDPKQSIYAFRGADISSYLAAKNQVSSVHTMNVNYRSTGQMVAAANAFFLPEPDFDTFYFPDSSDKRIDYIPVESAQHSGCLLQDQTAEPAISIMSFDNKPDLKQAIVDEICRLLHPENAYRIKDKKGQLHPVKPADIGILVRLASDGNEIKKLLEARNIPAVIRNDDKVLQSSTAKEIAAILEAVLEPALSPIHRGLFTQLIGWDRQELQEFDEEKMTARFRRYQSEWLQKSTYAVLSSIKKDFGLEERLTALPGGLRILSDFVQIMQLLHQYQHRKMLSAEELLTWLQKSTQGLENEGDAYELQIESDEDAVKIDTIHKSKGLEYNIVFCENLSFNNSTPSKHEFTNFNHDESHLFFDTALLSDTWKADWALQNAQENRRLMYVAVTRAAYKCYIGYSTGRSKALGTDSCLQPFIEAINNKESFDKLGMTAPSKDGIGNAAPFDKLRMTMPATPSADGASNAAPNLIALYMGSTLPAPVYKPETAARISFLDYDPASISLAGSNWRKMSFSALTAKGLHQPIPEEGSEEQQDDYANFVFNTLQRGSYTGNMLHFLLEQTDFKDERNHHHAIERSLNRYAKNQQLYEHYLPQLIRHVVQAKLQSATQQFSLSAIPASARLSEMEFNFMVPPLKAGKVLSVATQHIPLQFSLQEKHSLEGFMNGFIDLFFEHEGQYYILDWKSNYLGNRLEYYKGDLLDAAMAQQNYHLQYLIYTIAANKFLKSRLGADYQYEKHFGGVFYLFLRGLRAGSDSGIFYTKPSAVMIEQLDQYFQVS